MSCLSWNCRGLASPRALRFLRDLARRKNPSFIFLCETMINEDRIVALRNAMGFENSFVVDSVRKKGGLAFLWKSCFDVTVLGWSNHYVDLCINSDQSWRLTGFYGCPERSRRRESWDFLQNLSLASSLPWCVLGDFNDILAFEEKKGGVAQPNWLVNGFRDTVSNCGLVDIGAAGYKYTWSRGRGDGRRVEERLDRVLCSNEWMAMFPEARVNNLEQSTSDHLPIFLAIIQDASDRSKRVFRFNNSWLIKKDCAEVVNSAWSAGGNRELSEKLIMTRDSLKSWSGDKGPQFKSRLDRLRRNLSLLQNRSDSGGSRQYVEAAKEYNAVLGEEEVHWKQRAKCFWLSEGDSNTRFFHNFANSRRRTNSIDKLRDEDGVWKSSKHEVEGIISRYFENLFSDSSSSPIVLDVVVPCVSNDDNEGLLCAILG
ncbi:uncharacterized protein LOC126672876 [Mercurialis annua]|uniref:uncharacterized protein LOC126672876 n=1 Tax=Mercurialis annua TaxID=3986 RepID=UPI002160074E|nr:uncharacterized protein LOC126672876 [Mercurialis annua]